jgi:hypothetical protein
MTEKFSKVKKYFLSKTNFIVMAHLLQHQGDTSRGHQFHEISFLKLETKVSYKNAVLSNFRSHTVIQNLWLELNLTVSSNFSFVNDATLVIRDVQCYPDFYDNVGKTLPYNLKSLFFSN